MLVKDIRSKNDKELLKLVDDLKAELFMLRFRNSTGQLDQPHKINNVKKDIAKIFTVLHERAKNIDIKSKQKPAKVAKATKTTKEEKVEETKEEVKTTKEESK